MLCMISYDLRMPGRDYSALYTAIKSCGAWWHYLGSTWIVNTTQTIDNVATLLRSMIDQNDSIIVVDITGKTCDGWLPQKAWDWIRDNNS